MKNSSYIKSAVAQAALEIAPPLIRSELLAERDFREEYELGTNQVLELRQSRIRLRRSDLFEAVRNVLAGKSESKVIDLDGRPWTVRKETRNEQLEIIVSSAEQHYRLGDFGVLSSEAAVRVRSLDDAATGVNLPAGAREKWRALLTKRVLVDEEVELFHSDLRNNPVQMAGRIRGEFEAGESNMSSLVPPSRGYYERLVGVYDGSETTRDYAAGAGRDFLAQLRGWQTRQGFLYSLLLSSHASLNAEVAVEHLSKDDLVELYDFVKRRADVLSKVGAIEVGLRVLSDQPELEVHILDMIRHIRDDDENDGSSEIKLFAALFAFVDGEISRARILAEEPPFYRRLASLAQAALIHRQVIGSGIDYGHISGWAFDVRGEQFYMQCLADMRTEPRWNPDFAQANQMKMDFFGRIMIAASNFHENIRDRELRKLVLSEKPGSLYASSTFPGPYLPGPLEGRRDHTSVMPAEIAKVIESQLEASKVEPSSFAALVNSSVIFSLEAGHVELAARVLRMANYRLENVKDENELAITLSGLGIVAAVTRSRALAEELRILVRRYRHDRKFGLSIDMTLRICLIASASVEDLMEWREFVGDWLTELAFDELSGEEAEILYSHLQCLLQAVPELWVSCGKADAALNGLCAL